MTAQREREGRKKKRRQDEEKRLPSKWLAEKEPKRDLKKKRRIK